MIAGSRATPKGASASTARYWKTPILPGVDGTDVPSCRTISTTDAAAPGQAAGIDSPGLTSSLAIGEMMAELVDEVLG